MKLHWQIAIALVAALVAGSLIGEAPWFIHTTSFIGTMFLNALKMLIVPLIVSAMIHAILGLKDTAALSRLGAATAGLFVITTLLAVATGMALINGVQPGVVNGQPAGALMGLSAHTDAVLDGIAGRGAADVVAVFQRMVPANLFQAAVDGEMLGLIFFSLLFGFFASRLPPDLRTTQRQFWGGLYEVMIAITNWVMKFAALGVFGLVGRTVAQTGWSAMQPMLVFFVCVLAGLVIHALLTLSVLLRLSGLNPLAHLRAMVPVLLTAFSTSSSAATLPVTMDHVQRRGASSGVAGFVLPLGATVNMNGTALYECAVALFIAQAYGLELSLVTQAVVLLLALLTSIGVAGIPSASLVAIAVILTAVGLPLEGIGLVLAVDRILDMSRTAVNVYCDTVVAMIVAKRQGDAIDDPLGAI